MSFNKTFAGIAAGIALAGASGMASAQEENTDPRICAQPFAGELIQVSCANIASIIASQG
jgi:predicted outer membrane protein